MAKSILFITARPISFRPAKVYGGNEKGFGKVKRAENYAMKAVAPPKERYNASIERSNVRRFGFSVDTRPSRKDNDLGFNLR